MGYARQGTDPRPFARRIDVAARRGALGAIGALGATLGQTALATAADAILASLPAGSGVNPITPEMNAAAGYVNTVDTQYGGSRATPFYWVNPVMDKSGLIQWTGSDSAQFVDGLTSAQLLAAQILLAGGDKSWSADYNPPNQTYVDQTAAANLNPNAVQQNYTAPAFIPTANNAVLDQTGTPLVNTYPANDPRNFNMTQDQLDEYIRTHGGNLPGDPAGGTGGTVLSPDSAQGAIDAVAAAGGDPTQWTQVVDRDSGAPVALVRQGSSGLEMMPTTTRSANIVNTVTGFIDKAAGTLAQLATDVQKVGNAVKGGAAGASAGYNAPTNLQPWLIGGAAVILLLIASADRGRS